MSRRSISKTFNEDVELNEILDWTISQLPTENESVESGEYCYLKQRVRITVNFDPDNKMSLLPEGAKSNGKAKG